jgi:hypothetical protein
MTLWGDTMIQPHHVVIGILALAVCAAILLWEVL